MHKITGPASIHVFSNLTSSISLQTLLAISRVGRGGRSRRKRNGAGAPEHSPLDLSAAGESAAKRARLSASPSTRSDSDERDRVSNDGEYLITNHNSDKSVGKDLIMYDLVLNRP